MFSPIPPKPDQPPTPVVELDLELDPTKAAAENAAAKEDKIAPEGSEEEGREEEGFEEGDEGEEDGPEDDGLEDRRFVRPRSGAVTAVGVVNFGFGATEFICGALLLTGATYFGADVPHAPADFENEFNDMAGRIPGRLVAFGILLLIMSALMCVAGFGVLLRRAWGRVVSLILAGLAVTAVLASLNPLNPVSVIVHVGYAGLVIAILMNPPFAAEFYPESSADAAARSGTAEKRNFLRWPVVPLCLAAFLLGILCSWSIFRQTDPAPEEALILVTAVDAKSQPFAVTVAQTLVHGRRLRVIDPLRNQAEPPADLGAHVLVIVTDDGDLLPFFHYRVVAAQTGVLLASGVLDKGRAWMLADFIEQAVHLRKREIFAKKV